MKSISLRLHYQDQVIRVDVPILSASGEAPLCNMSFIRSYPHIHYSIKSLKILL